MTCKPLHLIMVLFAVVGLAPSLRAADRAPQGGVAPIPPANPRGPYEVTWVIPPVVESHNFAGDVIFSADGKRLLVAVDGEALVWDTATWKPVGPRIRYGDWLWNVALDAAGKRVMVVRSVMAFPADVSFRYVDAEWRVWDAETGKAVGPAVRHDKKDSKDFPAKHARMSPDGQGVAVFIGQTVELSSVVTGEKKHSFQMRREESVDRFAADSKSFVVSDYDGNTRVWDIAAGDFRAVGATPLGAGYHFANGRRLEDTGFGFRVLDVRTGKKLLDKDNHYEKYEVLDIHISASGNRVAVESGLKNQTQVWDVESGKIVGSIPSPDVMTIDRAGSTLLALIADESALWSADTGKKLRDLGEQFVHTAAFSPDGDLLAIMTIVGNNRVVRVIRADPAKKGDERWTVEGGQSR